jgi:hypothetical protein
MGLLIYTSLSGWISSSRHFFLPIGERLEFTWYCGHCSAYLYQFQMMMIVEQLMELELAGETELLVENLTQRHFVHHESHTN